MPKYFFKTFRRIQQLSLEHLLCARDRRKIQVSFPGTAECSFTMNRKQWRAVWRGLAEDEKRQRGGGTTVDFSQALLPFLSILRDGKYVF